jgi:ankyrin repeat protein
MSIAAQAGNKQLVKLSLEYLGGRPNLANMHGMTPLSLAVANGHTEVTKLLLQHDAVTDSLNIGNGRNLFSWAAYE